MKKFFGACLMTLLFSVTYGQDKTPVLSEMGSLRTETAHDSPGVIAESDSVVVLQQSEKQKRAKKLRKKAEISDAKKTEALREE
jgi:hypothetical protein